MSDAMKLTPAQERAAVLRINENLALRSGAGCGKTAVLAKRFHSLLMRQGKDANPLSRLVALTFTEKAAMEMSQRVRSFLTAVAKTAEGLSRQTLLSWLEELPDARISTIHGFCASVLRARAIEAGVDPDFSVCPDETLTDQMLTLAAEEAVLAAVEAGRPDATSLVAESSLEAVAGLAAQLVEMRASCDLSAYGDAGAILHRWRRLAEGARQQAWRRLSEDDAIRTLLDELAKLPYPGEGDKLAQYRRRQADLVGKLISKPASRRPEAFEQLRESPGNIGSAANWGGKDSLKEARRRMKELNSLVLEYAPYAEDLGTPDARAAESLAALVRLATDVAARYATAKRRRGILDFTDLLERTDVLLKDRPDVCNSLGGKIDQLLLDECQDTDAFQMALLERLAFGTPRPDDLPQGRLFVVGDAKQSIYRFRGAQVEVFEDLCRRLGPSGQENLDLSFRTHPAAAAFVNHLFSSLMGRDYQPIHAARGQCPASAAVEVLLASGGQQNPIDSANQAVRLQAAVTVQRIQEMIEGREELVWDEQSKGYRAVRPGDVAILFGRIAACLDFERELAGRNIPWYVVAGTGFFHQQEVLDVLNALRVIDNPYDDVALFGVLRSGLVGLDDEALMRISLACRPPYWRGLAIAAATLPQPQRRCLESAWRFLDRLHSRKDAVGIDVLIESLLEETGYEATLLSRFQGRRPLGNVRLLLDRARSAAAEGVVLADFITAMEERILDESRHEQAAVAGETDNVVRLMTIHKAKGLEFPVVFIPDLNWSPQGPRRRLMLRSDWGLLYRPPDGNGLREESPDRRDDAEPAEKPLSWRLASALEDQDQRKEDIRKLYVAATRAKDHLVFVAADWRDKDGQFQRGDCLIRRIDAALGIGQAADQQRDSIPYDGGRYDLRLRVLSPSIASGREKGTPARVILSKAQSADDVAEGLARLARSAPPPPLLADLPESADRAELAVTAISDFAFCPMLYRWQYELRVSAPPAGNRASPPPESISSAALGSILHRCMELLDFASPAPAETLVGRAIAEVLPGGLDDAAPIAAQLDDMLARMRRGPLWPVLTTAKRMHRELDFALAVGRGVLHGKIDLLLEDAAGGWTIVDYKSDRVGPEGVAGHAQRYELQVLAYALASARYLDRPPTRAVLYFLRPAVAHSLNITQETLLSAQRRLETLVGEILSASRTGRYAPKDTARCPSCPYGPLCRPN